MYDKADGKLDSSTCSHIPLTVLIKFGADMPKLLLVGLVERTCAKTVVREIPGIVDCFQLAGDDKDGKIVVRSPDRPLCATFASIHLVAHSSLRTARTLLDFGNSLPPWIR